MRAVVTDKYKLIWNLAYQLPKQKFNGKGDVIPNAVYEKKLKYCGKRKVKDLINRPEIELYDIRKDSAEVKNLAYKKQHKKLVKELKEKIITFQKNTGDPFLKLNLD